MNQMPIFHLIILTFLYCRGQVLFSSVESILIPILLSTCGQTDFYRRDITHVLGPLTVDVLLFTSAANRIQTGIATIIVLEYSAFLQNGLKGTTLVQSAVDYYLKSPTAVAVEKGAKEICRQGYHGEELGKKVLEFILENRLSKDMKEKK
ncbi:uncharacterized protein HD556DRAFT_1442168 [Suillus plorans]|uniref:Uncharacterized protein n=1 Tax=Suillus plorans TaxID=116603 RepID=A0A9P7DJB4_9AGAM|nr:uncharacterized protein HD556DRAFT_1442168 [Suillus plorans]KAG1795319.1 hypothetical protein HD556DRAFT_1442168 [Suillus plorans]